MRVHNPALNPDLIRAVQDELATPFIQDFQEDIQLQRAIREAFVKAGLKLADVPEFRGFAGKFD